MAQIQSEVWPLAGLDINWTLLFNALLYPVCIWYLYDCVMYCAVCVVSSTLYFIYLFSVSSICILSIYLLSLLFVLFIFILLGTMDAD